MRLLLAVLAALGIGCGADSHAIRYPYRAELLSYAPARGEFPVQNAQAHGYVRYLAEDGSDRLISYKYPEPLYGLRRVSHEGTSLSPDNRLETEAELQHAQKRLDHFRAWCQQRYEALQLEVERLHAEGKQPPADMLAQLKPLETILGAANYNVIGEAPEVKRAREEHLRVWNEARLKVLQLEAEQLKLQGQQAADVRPITYDQVEGQQLQQPLVAISETEEQKKARAEHLRIYNEHLLRVQHLQAENLRDVQQPASIAGEAALLKAANTPVQPDLNITEQQQQVVHETPEVQRAKEEHLRLWNEAKLRAEQEVAYKQDAIIANLKATTYSAQAETSKPAITAEISPSLAKATPAPATPTIDNLTSGIFKADSTTALASVVNTAPGIPHKDFPALPSIDSTDTQVTAAADPAALNVIPGVQQTIPAPSAAPQPMQVPQAEYTAPVIKEAQTLTPTVATPQAPAQIQDTPEVQRAREEHLKLVKEAQIKASQLSIPEQQQASGDIVVSVADELLETERLRVAEEKLRTEESLREKQRIQEETRLLEAERLRLQQEEQRRAELERLAELDQRKQELQPLHQQQQQQPQQLKLGQEQRFELPAQAQPAELVKAQLQPTVPLAAAITKDALPASGEYNNNPFLTRFAFVAQQKPVQFPNVGYYYLPDASPTAHVDNPFLVRHMQIANQNKDQNGFDSAALRATPAVQLKSQDAQQASSSIAGQDAGLAELEKARREHFRAHEIALEQLRAANAKSDSEKDCKQNAVIGGGAF